MLIVLLLCAAFGVDSMYGLTQKGYGEVFKIYLLSSAHKITFTSDHLYESTLWTLAGGSVRKDPRYQSTESFFLIRRLTQQDTGQYHTCNRHDVLLSSAYIRIEPNEQSRHLSEGDSVSFDFDLQRDQCNVFFTSHSTNERSLVVYQGRLKRFRTCGDIRLNGICKIILRAVETSCLGTFEFTDDNDDVALKVTVTVGPRPLIPVYSLVGFGAAVAAALCCCLKCVCCRKTKKKKDNLKPEDAVDEAELTHGPREFVHNMVQLGPRELGENLPDSRPPPVAPTAPLIHDAPVVDPPCYEEAVTMPTPEGSLPPFSSDSEPRFEISGLRFSADPGLGSEGSSSEVYTSDKLSFR